MLFFPKGAICGPYPTHRASNVKGQCIHWSDDTWAVVVNLPPSQRGIGASNASLYTGTMACPPCPSHHKQLEDQSTLMPDRTVVVVAQKSAPT